MGFSVCVVCEVVCAYVDVCALRMCNRSIKYSSSIIHRCVS